MADKPDIVINPFQAPGMAFSIAMREFEAKGILTQAQALELANRADELYIALVTGLYIVPDPEHEGLFKIEAPKGAQEDPGVAKTLDIGGDL